MADIGPRRRIIEVPEHEVPREEPLRVPQEPPARTPQPAEAPA